MTPIIPDIFNIWEMVETTFADKGNTVNRTYRKKWQNMWMKILL